MKFIKKNKTVDLSMESDACRLTKGLHTSLFLNGLGFWNLQPKYAYLFGGAEAFCRAWAMFMKVPFNGDCETFYKHFDFDIIEKSEELTKLIRDLVNRDIEPITEESESAPEQARQQED